MSRKKQPRWSVRFELAPESPEDVRLHEYLDVLAEGNEVSAWIRRTLAAAVPPQVNQDAQLDEGEPPKSVAATPVPPDIYGVSLIDSVNKIAATEKKVEQKTIDVKPMNETPAQVIARRKAEALARHPIVNPLNGRKP